MTGLSAEPDYDCDVIELFAGPGGWSEGLRNLDPTLREVGIEWDGDACATAVAAGHARIHGDVRNYGPGDFPMARGLIASPPCPTFSNAGSGSGREELNLVFEALDLMAIDVEPDVTRFSDERTALVLEPFRWVMEAVAEDPFSWVALEQVPPALPVWEHMAGLMRNLGYSVVTGIVNAEQYGVPQTRRRAVLLAHRCREVQFPEPTHSRYHTRQPAKLDPGVKKWVSMSEALGWSDAGVVISNYGTGGNPAARGQRLMSQPSSTITSKVGSMKFEVDPQPEVRLPLPEGYDWALCPTNYRPNAALRKASAPAPTMGFGHEQPRWLAVGFDGQVVRRIEGDERSRPVTAGTTKAPDSIRVTPHEAGVLQSFPGDYPWQGSKSSRYLQVGNAVPPLLAEAMLRAVAP